MMKLSKEKIMAALDQHQATLKGFGVTRIGLFGSMARGEATEASDLDFVVDFDRYTFDNYMDTKYFLEDLFGCKVDLAPIKDIKPLIKKQILEETIYVKGLE